MTGIFSTDVVVGVSPCYLEFVRNNLPADRFGVAAQNCYKVASGAFTGNFCWNNLNLWHLVLLGLTQCNLEMLTHFLDPPLKKPSKLE